MNSIPDGFRHGLVKLDADGGLVTSTAKAQAIISGFVRKDEPKRESAEPKMASHINHMKAKGSLRSRAVPRSGIRENPMDYRYVTPKPKKTYSGMPKNRGE